MARLATTRGEQQKAPRRSGPGHGHAIEGRNMPTLPPPTVSGTTPGRQAAADLQNLLRHLGVDEERLGHITRWADLGDQEYVYVPPLPADVVARLVNLAQSASAS